MGLRVCERSRGKKSVRVEVEAMSSSRDIKLAKLVVGQKSATWQCLAHVIEVLAQEWPGNKVRSVNVSF